jgi:hypothetical protein
MSPAHDPVRDLNNIPAKAGLVLKLSSSIRRDDWRSKRDRNREKHWPANARAPALSRVAPPPEQTDEGAGWKNTGNTKKGRAKEKNRARGGSVVRPAQCAVVFGYFSQHSA